MEKRSFMQSTAVRIILLSIALLMPFNIVTSILMRIVTTNSQEQMNKEIQISLEMNARNLVDSLKKVSLREIYMCVNSERTEFQELSGSLDKYTNIEKADKVRKVQESVKDIRSEHTIADLIWYYFPQNDYIVTGGSPGVSRDMYLEMIREKQDDGRKGMQWTQMDIDGVMVLFGNITWNKINCGVLINLNRAIAKIGLTDIEQNRVAFFTDMDETKLTDSGKKFLAEKGISYESLEKSKDYNIYVVPMEDYGIKLVEIVKKEDVFSELPISLKLLEGISLILVIISIPILLYFEKRWMINPLSKLTKAIGRIEKGDIDYRIKVEDESTEFAKIDKSFNSMMDQVSELKIHLYETQLEKQQIKMKFLSQQIQPHFILNTLNILYSYEQEEYPLIQKMILLLSKYFRYIVNANSEFVMLKEEMDHIRNYFDIQQVRYPDTFFSMVEYDEEIADCLVPPLLIQNFAENSIKHSIKIGNHIDIFVIAQKIDEHSIRIRMLDTGEGVNEDVIQKIERFRETGEYQKGLGVGIQNAIERLKVLYGVETSFEISRDEPHGTRITIVLPIHR